MSTVETPFQFLTIEGAESFKTDLVEVIRDMGLVINKIQINHILPESFEQSEKRFKTVIKGLMLHTNEFDEKYYLPYENPNNPTRVEPEARFDLSYESDEAVNQFIRVAGTEDRNKSANLIYNDFRDEYESRKSCEIPAYNTLQIGANILQGVQSDCPKTTGYTVEIDVKGSTRIPKPKYVTKPLMEFAGRLYINAGFELTEKQTVPDDIEERIDHLEFCTDYAASYLTETELQSITPIDVSVPESTDLSRQDV